MSEERLNAKLKTEDDLLNRKYDNPNAIYNKQPFEPDNHVNMGFYIDKDKNIVATTCLNEAVAPMQKIMNAFLKFKNESRQTLELLSKAIQRFTDTAKLLPTIGEEVSKLMPFLVEVAKKPKYANVKGDETLDVIADIFKEANELKEKEEALNKSNIKKYVTRHNKTNGTSVIPLDRLNTKLIMGLTDEELAQIEQYGSLLIRTSQKNDTNKIATVIFGLQLEETLKSNGVSLSRSIPPYKLEIQGAIASLLEVNTDGIMTLPQIYNQMGHTGRPTPEQTEKINEALTEMRNTTIQIDNTSEHEILKYKKFVYDGALIPFERIKAEINEKLSETVIKVFRTPPLVEYAKNKNQVTEVPQKLLDDGFKKTDTHLKIRQFLLQEIAHIKNGRRKNKILYETIFEKLEVKSNTQKSRLKTRMCGYEKSRSKKATLKAGLLIQWKEKKYIKNFKESKDGVIITV